MDNQERYDELDEIVSSLNLLVDSITDKNYIDMLNEIKFEAQTELEEIEEMLIIEQEKEEAEERISEPKVNALKTAIKNNKISNSVVALILANYNYSKIEDIEIKNYMNIVNDLRAKK